MGYSFARMEAHPTRTVVRIQTRNQLRASLLCHGGPFTFFIITIITVTRTFFSYHPQNFYRNHRSCNIFFNCYYNFYCHCWYYCLYSTSIAVDLVIIVITILNIILIWPSTSSSSLLSVCTYIIPKILRE